MRLENLRRVFGNKEACTQAIFDHALDSNDEVVKVENKIKDCISDLAIALDSAQKADTAAANYKMIKFIVQNAMDTLEDCQQVLGSITRVAASSNSANTLDSDTLPEDFEPDNTEDNMSMPSYDEHGDIQLQEMPKRSDNTDEELRISKSTSDESGQVSNEQLSMPERSDDLAAKKQPHKKSSFRNDELSQRAQSLFDLIDDD